MAIILVLAMVASANFTVPAMAEQVDVYENNQLVKFYQFSL